MDISRLNPAQASAVTSGSRALLVLAGAGTGKTETLTSRIAYMVKDRSISPRDIIAMTFTNKAAKEMKERAARLSDVSYNELNIGTFHSMCSWIIRTYSDDIGIARDFRVIDDYESFVTMKDMCVTLFSHKRKYSDVKVLKNIINNWKNDSLEWTDVGVSDDVVQQEALCLYEAYTKACRENGVIDFGDMLVVVVKALQNNPGFKEKCNARWKHILVDEFQDTNKIQMDLIKALYDTENDEHSITVVGDDYQCIHEWRGADVRNILRFEDHYADVSVVPLELNYRSTPVIVNAADVLIRNNERQRHKSLVSVMDTVGAPIRISRYANEEQESKNVVQKIVKLGQELGEDAFGEVAILFRTNAQSRHFEADLRNARVPYVLKGAYSFFERAEVKDMIAYARLIVKPDSDKDFLRVANVPSRKIGKSTMRKLEVYAEEHECSMMHAVACGGVKHAGLKAFHAVVKRMAKSLEESDDFSNIFKMIVEETDYLDKLREDGETNMQRQANIEELTKSVKEYIDSSEEGHTDVNDYLNSLTLYHNDTTNEDEVKKVKLMTFHSAKGLEFGHVFMVSAYDKMIPHACAIRDGTVEAERRLFYVGMTRAKHNLYISFPAMRLVWGKREKVTDTLFIDEIPQEYRVKVM